MALTATNSMVLDLSGDHDNAGNLAATASIPTASTEPAFERSCDNPECSAPKLISLVPKQETPEFITDPVIMNQPTLINGFTTVFQIDGIGARMNDIMYGDDNSDPNTSNGINAPSKPKSVFRIVPNTHAHIVNYVVVDGAGETMRKIKSNDADTMRKLLDSQRISAEQMLKKLVGKAFKTSVRSTEPGIQQATTNNAPASGTPIPEPRHVPIFSAHQSPDGLPVVPPGITITPIPLTDAKTTAKPNSTSLSRQGATLRNPPCITSPTKTITTLRSAASTPSANIQTPILRRSLITRSSDESKSQMRPNFLKRKLVSAPIPDAVKRLRPRSPKQKSPLAVGRKLVSNAPPNKKLSTTPKLPTTPANTTAQTILHSRKVIASFSPPKNNINWSSKIRDEDESSTEAESLSNHRSYTSFESCTPKYSPGSSTNACTEPSSIQDGVFFAQNSIESVSQEKSNPPAVALIEGTTESIDSLTLKRKHVMGPASKMNAIRANAAAKVNATQESRQDISGGKQSTIDVPILPKIRPCSVSITKADDLVASLSKVNESLNQDDGRFKSSEFQSKISVQSIATAVSKTYPPTRPKSRQTTDNDTDDTKANVLSTICTKVGETPNNKLNKQNQMVKTDSTGRTSLATAIKSNISKVNVLSAPKTIEITSPKLGTGSSITRNTKAVQKLDNFSDFKSSNKPTVNATKTERPGTRTSMYTTPTSKVDRLSTLPLVSKSDSTSPKQGEALSPCTTPMQSQSRILRVVLPTLKSGVLTAPETSPHPNLKISSVISGGSAISASALRVDTRAAATKTQENSGAHIEKLQQELADLRRTVARLSKKKP